MVFDEATERQWERAMERAREQHITALWMGEVQRGYDSTVDYDVSSACPGKSYRVAVRYSGNGVEAICGCPAGTHSMACKHCAAALKAEGWLPLPVIPEPEYELATVWDTFDPQDNELLRAW